jgi:hypothetical protein
LIALDAVREQREQLAGVARTDELAKDNQPRDAS